MQSPFNRCHMALQYCLNHYHLEVHHRRRCREEVLVSVQMLFISSRRPPGLPLSVVMHTVHRPVRGLVAASLHGATLMIASSAFVRFSRSLRRAATTASDVNVSSRSAKSAPILRMCMGCESAPASSPRRPTRALAGASLVNRCSSSSNRWCSLGVFLRGPHADAFCGQLCRRLLTRSCSNACVGIILQIETD